MAELAVRARALASRLGRAGLDDTLEGTLAPLRPEAVRAGVAGAAADAAHLVACALWAARSVDPRASTARDLLGVLCTAGVTSELAATLLERVSEIALAPPCAAELAALTDAALSLPASAPALLHGYESFLSSYDADMRRACGVYLTPAPLVDHVLERTDGLLREELGMEAGLDAEHGPDGGPFVVMDPAAGTGAFLVRALERAGARAPALAQRLCGFELLPVPYVICQLQLRLALRACGGPARAASSFAVYLGSALGDGEAPRGRSRLARLHAREREAGAELRRSRSVRIVMGNPPYRRGAPASSAWLEERLLDYKRAVRAERNLQPLADDYVRFLAMAQAWVTRGDWGIVSLVTPSAYLFGRVYRGVRQQLSSSFPRIDHVDLHGSVQGQGPPPWSDRDGRRDQNVFGIAQGIAVSAMCRGATTRRLRYASVAGSLEHKYRRLGRPDELGFREVRCEPPHFAFHASRGAPPEYATFTPLDALFSARSIGAKPGDDRTLVGFDEATLLEGLRAMRKALASGARRRPSEAQRKLARRGQRRPFDRRLIRPYAYRPFDERLCYDEPELWTRPVPALRRLADGGPLLLTTRVVKDHEFAHVFVCRALPDVIALSATSSVNCHAFPRDALCPDVAAEALGLAPDRRELFAYVYAILHSRGYRARYFEELRLDFPRIPWPSAAELLGRLAALGGRLLALHLGECEPPPADRPRFIDGGDRRVLRVGEPGRRLTPAGADAGRLAINAVSAFEPIPVSTWSMHVGGYQVLHKWLYDRQRAGRTLSSDDVDRYARTVAVLTETGRVMDSIELAIAQAGGWPAAFA